MMPNLRGGGVFFPNVGSGCLFFLTLAPLGGSSSKHNVRTLHTRVRFFKQNVGTLHARACFFNLVAHVCWAGARSSL